MLVLGFGLKMGLAPLHVWLPLAHPAAPMPASAVLSGVVVKAGVIGLIRFLPLGVPSRLGRSAGGRWPRHRLWRRAGRRHPVRAEDGAGILHGEPDGARRCHPRRGAGAGRAWFGPTAAFYALHHMLAKGALFLSVGIVAATSSARLRPVLVVALLLGLGLAGLPLTGGALAKLAMKPGLGEGLALLASLAAAGSTLLMLHLVQRLAVSGTVEPAAAPKPAQVAPWLAVAAASVILPAWLFTGVTGLPLSTLFELKSLWGLLWPLVLGAAAFALLQRLRRSLPAIPEGDVIVFAAAGGPALARVANACVDFDATVRRWPVACLLAVVLVLAFSGALWP